MLRLTDRDPDKNRFLKTFKHDIANDEISFFETEFSPNIVKKIIDVENPVRSYMLDGKNYVKFLTNCGIDIMYVHVPHSPGRKEIIAEDGRKHFVGGNIKCIEDLKKVYKPQDISNVKMRIEEILKSIESTNLGWCYAFNGPGSIIPQIGYTEYYILLYESPSFIHEFLKRQEESIFFVIDEVLKYDPDAVFISADLCIKTGMSMKMSMAEEFFLTYMERQVNRIKKSKDLPIILHSDGDNSELMDRWIKMGINGIHPMENCKNFNIYDVKVKWGDKITLMGNIDVFLLSNGTVGEVEKDTLEHLRNLSKNGGYICGSSHDIDDNCKLENIKTMVNKISGFKKTNEVQID